MSASLPSTSLLNSSNSNGSSNLESLSIRLSGANANSSSDKLKKLQINKNSNEANNSNLEYEEIVATIRKSEKGFGFELRNGILIVKVLPNTPAFHSGIRVGDIVIKVNGTCVKSKEPSEITNMIYESNSFVSLTLQRQISQINSNKAEQKSCERDDSPLANVTNQMNTKDQSIETTKNEPSLKPLQHLENNFASNSDYNDNENNENNKHDTSDLKCSINDDSLTLTPTSTRKSTLTTTSDENDQEAKRTSELNNNLNVGILHRKQNSMSDDLERKLQQQQNEMHRNSVNNSRRAIKKTRSSVNPTAKTFQTQSLSNIAASTLVHSTSDNDLDNQNNQQQQQSSKFIMDPDDQNLLEYKDDFSFNSEDNLNDTHNDKPASSSLDASGFSDYSQLVNKPINLSILLNYILSSQREDSSSLYFCIFVDDLIYSSDKKETIFRWIYELYSTFLMANAPLKIKANELTCKKIEELIDKSLLDNVNHIRKLMEDVKQEAIETVNNQLNKFREVKQLGLANLFHGNDLVKLSQTYKNDTDLMRSTLAESFHMYVGDISKDVVKISNDWNDMPTHHEAKMSALICSFATFVKKFNIPIKHIGKFELEKIPMFVNKKLKSKKNSSNQSSRGHSLIENQFLSTKIICCKCNQPFWGVGNQGFVCQKSKCELKLHRSCFASGVFSDCHGSQKTIRTDYKEKFSNILFGIKKKEEEQIIPMDTSSSTPTPKLSNNQSFINNSVDYQGNYDRQGTILNGDQNQLNSFPSDYEQRNLPVELAIKKFEMLNAKKSVPIVTSPNGNGVTLVRANTISSGGSSPPNSASAVQRTNSISNGQSFNENISLKNELKSNQHSNNATNNNILNQILPNKQHTSNSATSNTTKATKEQACKRVGSLKVDVKKIKSNVTRSKSDPEPEEIKNAMNTAAMNSNNNNNYSDKYSLDSTLIDDSYSNTSINTTNTTGTGNNSQFNYSAAIGPIPSNLNIRASATPSIGSLSHQNSSIFGFSTNSSTSYTASRHSWMNDDSDMEVDEELPSLSVNIEKQHLEKLTKKEMKIQEVINELIHTEQKHVRNLKIMKHHFYIPIKIEMCLTDDERNLLFPNLDEILELHSSFNNKLKGLRKEHAVVPIKELIDIILGQFEGDTGDKFKNACATFCQNQGEAMKLLQNKMKHDKFSIFLSKAENDQVCRKLHLKDFIPTEVQRLVKYRLLFHELTKNAEEDDKAKLIQCMDASSNISQYVNKAVTECENKKRCQEIQHRMDTKEFDQYCVRSPLLAPYKSLDFRKRKLIYEGELEWKTNGSLKLMALLFQDILVFLERERSNEEKRRYLLRPLLYTINNKKMFFTPVIPLQCINSFSPTMHEKRNFHLVVIIDDSSSNKSNKSTGNTKSIETQMLFMFTAKSGDERNKWTSYLQELTGKMSQTVNSSVELNNHHHPHQQSTSSLMSLTSNASANKSTNSSLSASNLMTNVSGYQTVNNNDPTVKLDSGIKPKKLSVTQETMADNTANPNKYITTTINNDSYDFDMLKSKLNENTQSIVELLKSRHALLVQLLNRTENIADINDLNMDLSIPTTNSQELIGHSFNQLNIMTNLIVNDDFSKSTGNSKNKNEPKLIESLIKLEKNLTKLQNNIKVDLMDSKEMCLPNLTLTNSNFTIGTKPKKSISMRKQQFRNSKSANNSKSTIQKTAINVPNITRTSPINESRFSGSEFMQQSSTANNADLSEDEQINYYNEYEDNNLSPKHRANLVTASELNANNSHGETSNNKSPIIIASPALANRRLSNSSDRTLVVMPTDSIITENFNLNKEDNLSPKHFFKHVKLNLEADEKLNFKFGHGQSGKLHDDDDEEDDDEFDEDEEDDEDDDDEEVSVYYNEDDDEEYEDEEDDKSLDGENEGHDLAGDKHLLDTVGSQDNLISIKIKSPRFLRQVNNNDDDEYEDDEYNQTMPPPSLPKSLPPEVLLSNTTNMNDLSDDEVKEYALKEGFDDSNA